MAGLMDDASGQMSNVGDGLRARYNELCHQEEQGELDDNARAELQQLRAHFESDSE